MRRLHIAFFCLLFVGCGKVGSVAELPAANSAVVPVISATVEEMFPLSPVVPVVELNAKQLKYLNQSVSPPVREILEKSESFEVLAEFRESSEIDGDPLTFTPNRVLNVSSEKDKKSILEAFFHDASREDPPAVCFYPRHLIRATYGEKTVEIDICFSCSRFFVDGAYGKTEGTIVRTDRRSERILIELLKEKGVTITR